MISGKGFLRIWWCIVNIFMLTLILTDSFWSNILVFLEITGWMFLKNLLIITAVFFATFGLWKLHPFFRWSWLRLFKNNDGNEDESEKFEGNICIMPTRVKYLGLLFLGLFIANLPAFALIEEKWFRQGIQNWTDGILWSILFGVIHCLVGVPICAGLAISIAGLWFTHQYFIGGIELSALHHTTYNLIALSVVFFALLSEHYVNLKKGKEPKLSNTS